MGTLSFIYENFGLILFLTAQHIEIVAVAVGLAILTGGNPGAVPARHR